MPTHILTKTTSIITKAPTTNRKMAAPTTIPTKKVTTTKPTTKTSPTKTSTTKSPTPTTTTKTPPPTPTAPKTAPTTPTTTTTKSPTTPTTPKTTPTTPTTSTTKTTTTTKRHIIIVFIFIFFYIHTIDAKGGKRKNRIKNQSTYPTTTTTTRPTTTKPPHVMDLPRNASAFDIMRSIIVNLDKNIPPLKDRPTAVQLGIYVLSFFSISEQTMDYSLSMYFRQAWRDPRMIFSHNNYTKIRLMDNIWDHIWVPDTFFKNEKGATFHRLTINNQVIALNTTGFLWYVSRITTTLNCPMRLEKFPFDSQVCPMQFESFGLQMDSMYFSWVSDPIELADGVKPPQFELIGCYKRDCSEHYMTGPYPCAEINFILQRDIGYYFIQLFIPSVLTVILSWVSFWINIDGVPARCTLGLLTVLTIVSQTGSVNATLPRVSYIKAIDVWLIVCLLFVFCALLEYAFVNVAARNGVKVRAPISKDATLKESAPSTLLPPKALPKAASSYQHHNLTFYHPSYQQVCVESADEACDHEFNPPEQPLVSKCWRRMKKKLPHQRGAEESFGRRGGRRGRARVKEEEGKTYQFIVDLEASKLKARNIDKFSRKVFPLAFLVFNVYYWISASIPAAEMTALEDKIEKC